MEYYHYKCNTCGHAWNSEHEESYCPACFNRSIEIHLQEE